jgi:hypothetical protein
VIKNPVPLALVESGATDEPELEFEPGVSFRGIKCGKVAAPRQFVPVSFAERHGFAHQAQNSSDFVFVPHSRPSKI